MTAIPKTEEHLLQAKSERRPWKIRWLGLLPLAFFAAFWFSATVYSTHVAAWPALGRQEAPQTEGSLLAIMRAGIINRVEGQMMCQGANGDWVSATAGRRLRNGGSVRTGPQSRVEILLAPGSYLRMSENTELVASNTSIYNLKLRLLEGSIIIEVAITDVMKLYTELHDLITVVTPQSEFAIVQGGIYRFNVEAGGRSEVVVREGKVIVDGVTIKKGRKAIVESGPPTVMAFDKKLEDAFDQWSRDRAASLIEANKSLKNEPWSGDSRRRKRPAIEQEKEELPWHMKNQHLVFARAGVVNIVEDGVVYKRGEADWTRLAAGDELQDGDVVSTGAESRAEILLNHDSYLRLSGDTEIVLSDTSPGKVKVGLVKGAVILDALAFSRKRGAVVTLVTPQAEWVLTQPGIYRFHADGNGRSELMVREGGIQFEGKKVKAGQKLVIDGARWAIVKFDRKAQDGFDIWSQERGEGLVTSSLPRTARFVRNFNRNRERYTGMWLFSSTFECYTYVPGYWSVSSPYGGTYPVRLNYRLLTRR
jgi:hypothetical protein